MAHYAIGDLQGCYNELDALLHKIGFNHGTDTLWLTGDIVNRGPQSLQCLQFARRHESSVRTVLGNHDLHLLAVAHGHGRLKRGDTLDDILNHPERRTLLDWLRAQPLMLSNNEYVLVHAGLLPQWSIAQAHTLAEEVAHELRHRPDAYFAHMYGNKPRAWSAQLSGYDRLRVITNAFTRMRALTYANEIDCDFKAGLADIPNGLRAWFEAPARQNLSHTIVFGHWSALGFFDQCGVLALDTGALWGGPLTAVNLADRQISQVESGSRLHWQTTLA